MSENQAAEEQEFDLEAHMAAAEETPEVADEQLPEQNDDVPEYLKEIPEEDRKFARGWNPNMKGYGAKTLDQYIQHGKMIDRIQRQEKIIHESKEEFRKRLEQVNKLNQIALQKQREELEERFKDAVNMSDMEEVKKVQKEMRELEEIEAEEEKDKPATFERLPDEERRLVQEWDAKNQWIHAANFNRPDYDPLNPNIPKALFAQKLIGELTQKGMMPSQLIDELDRQLSEKFPAESKPRMAPKSMPTSSTPGQKVRSRTVAWTELTRQELALYEGMPGAWGSKEEFLQAVTDSRGEK